MLTADGHHLGPCPHTPPRSTLVGAPPQAVRKDAYISTLAREVIDEATLASRSRRELAGAALECFEREPVVNPRWCGWPSRPRVMLPHMGSATIEGRVEMGEKVIINIRTFLDGHKPPDRILPSMV